MFLSVGINRVCVFITVLCKTTGLRDKLHDHGFTLCQICGFLLHLVLVSVVCLFPNTFARKLLLCKISDT